ncbi:MAG: hypothetical protein ACOX6U_00865 [Oscillospiraceae bacterium]|jgi:hypothetical protein
MPHMNEMFLFDNMPAFFKKLRRTLEAAAVGQTDAVRLSEWMEPLEAAAGALSPFFNAFGGSCTVQAENGAVLVRFAAPFRPFTPSQLPAAETPAPGLIGDLKACLWEIAVRSAAGGSNSLSDGLMHFGMLQGTGYYWSLADHRWRHAYGEHPKTFDELSQTEPTPLEQRFEDIQVIYDNHELELELRFRFGQDAVSG